MPSPKREFVAPHWHPEEETLQFVVHLVLPVEIVARSVNFLLKPLYQLDLPKNKGICKRKAKKTISTRFFPQRLPRSNQIMESKNSLFCLLSQSLDWEPDLPPKKLSISVIVFLSVYEYVVTYTTRVQAGTYASVPIRVHTINGQVAQVNQTCTSPPPKNYYTKPIPARLSTATVQRVSVQLNFDLAVKSQVILLQGLNFPTAEPHSRS